MTEVPRRGLMLVLSSPSGAGKSTLSRLLLQEDRALQLSISVTTRPRRGSEVDGVHYHFIETELFERLREGGDLLEWAQVHGNYYGTPRAPVEAALAAGVDMLFDIDWQGTLQLFGAARPDVVSVFVLPPSAEELRLRLLRRAEDDGAVIARRLLAAAAEVGHWDEYDYVLVNDDLQRAFEELKAILAWERLKRARRTEMAALAGRLIADLEAMSARPARSQAAQGVE